MEIIFNMLMVVVALLLMGAPFFQKAGTAEITDGKNVSPVEKKELLFSALGEIEFDYRMAKLSDDDYQELKAGYQQEAMGVLEQEDLNIEAEMEKEIMKRKKVKGQNVVSGEDHA